MDEDDAVRARHPNLRHSDVLLVPLRDVGTEMDRKLQRLARRRLRLKGCLRVDMAAVEMVESELQDRVVELAGRVAAADMKGRRHFLPRQRRSAGIVFAALHIPEDEEVVEWRLDVMENPACNAEDEAVAKKAMRRRGNALLDAFIGAEANIAGELHRLRRAFPNCVRDVNPSIESDDYLATLRGTFADWVAFMSEDDPALVQVQEEMRARSVALIGDDRCVADALNQYCVAEAELRLARAHRKPTAQVARLRGATDVAQYTHRIWSRRQARRHITAPLFDFPEDDADFMDDDGGAAAAESWAEEDTYAAHARAAHAAAGKDAYFLYLQRQKAVLTAAGHRSGVRCIAELLRRRLRQLTGDAARLQRSRQRRDNAVLRRYPFLQTRYMLSVPLPELRLDEDVEFMRLAEERERLLQPPSDLRARYPFLPAVINGVPIEELGLETDAVFMRLASQREDLIGPLRAKLRSVKEREEAMRVRMSERVAAYVAAENHMRDVYPFLDVKELPVSLQRLHLSRDAHFQRIFGEYVKLRKPSLSDDASLNSTTLHHAAGGQRSRVSSVTSTGSVATPRPHAKTVTQRRLEKQMREWVMRRAEEEAEWEFADMMDLESLADRFPFLPVEPLPGIHLGELAAFADVAFSSMAAELEVVRKKVAPPAEVAAAEQALLARVMELAEAKHTQTELCRQRHPRLPRRVAGVLMCDIDIPVCSEEVVESPDEALMDACFEAAEQVKARRVCDVGEDEAVRCRHPFLEMNDVHGVPLRQLPLSDDSIFLSYLRKWRKVLSAETIDREKLRIYEDLLRECAEEQALRVIDVTAAMAHRLEELQVADAVPASKVPLLDLHNTLVKARDLLVAEHKSGAVPPATADDRELLVSIVNGYAAASEDMMQEFTALRRRFPWSVRDVNPALRHDATFLQLEEQRQLLLASFSQMEMMESLETEERKRSVELIDDDAYVRDAETACAPSAQKPLRRLSGEEQTKRWKHQLRLRHRQRRTISFSDIPADAAETADGANAGVGSRAVKSRKSRERKKRSMSWTKLDVDVVPDNVFAEIKEDEFHTSLPASIGPSDTLAVPGVALPLPLPSERGYGHPLQQQQQQQQQQQRSQSQQSRRQRSHSGGRPRLGSVTAESIPDNDAYAMLDDGTLVPVSSLTPATPGAAVGESSYASSAVGPLPGATPTPSADTTLASSSDAAGLSPRPGAADAKKGKKRVLKKRLRARRTSTASVDAIPDETPGEVVEHDLDEIGSDVYRHVSTPAAAAAAAAAAARSDASDASARGPSRQATAGRQRIPQPPVQPPRKTLARQLPTRPRLVARSSTTGAALVPPRSTSRSASVSRAQPEPPVVRTQSRKRGPSRTATRMQPVLGEAPEVTVGMLREQEGDQPQQAPRDTTAAAMSTARRPELDQQHKSQPESRTASAARSKSRRRISRPASAQRCRISISQLEEEEVREIHTSVAEQRLETPAERRRRGSSIAPSDASHTTTTNAGAAATAAKELGRRSRKTSVAARGAATPTSARHPGYSVDPVLPEDGPEAAELAVEEAVVQRVLREARPTMARAVSQEEVEAGAEPMSYVFELHDLTRHAASGTVRTALLTARLRELEALLRAWVVQRSTTPAEPRAATSAKIQSVRQSRRLHQAISRDPVENPRQLPLRWARLTTAELDEDTGLRQLMDSAASQQRVAGYLAAWSARKQAANEALFAKFPFLPTLPCGYALTEIGFTNDPEFQRYARGGAHQESVHVQQQMHDLVERLARAKAAAAEGRRATRYVDRVRATVETTRDAAGPLLKTAAAAPASPPPPPPPPTSGGGGGDLTRLVKEAQALMEPPEDQQLLDAILAARVKRANRFLDTRQRLTFITQSTQEAERLIKRMMVRMKRERTSDIPLGMEDVETLRFFFDGVDVDHFGVLDRSDTVEFILLTLGEARRMSRAEVERLLFEDTPRGAVLPTLVDFSDFSKFYKSVALQELVKQDSSFDQQNIATAAAAAAASTASQPRRPEPPSTASPHTGGAGRRGRLHTVSAGVLPERRPLAATSPAASNDGSGGGRAAAAAAALSTTSARTPRGMEPRRPSSEPRSHHPETGGGGSAPHSHHQRHASAFTPPTYTRDRAQTADVDAAAAASTGDRWFVNGRPAPSPSQPEP
ncbi:tb-292 membrane associated protein-like protein [Novymonas esmeraldas]|uniref:Tb-292 membrane associated protein-like protein n=1 Tax=Novymonas esmeraldas TaxID=1808958 RepID=A0AAW0EZU1_9TRYP